MNFKKGCINVLLFSLIIKPTCHLNKLPEMMYFTLVFLPWIPHVLWFSFESTHYLPPFLIHNMTMFPFVTTYNPLSLSAVPLDRLYLPTETPSCKILACAVTSSRELLPELSGCRAGGASISFIRAKCLVSDPSSQWSMQRPLNCHSQDSFKVVGEDKMSNSSLKKYHIILLKTEIFHNSPFQHRN